MIKLLSQWYQDNFSNPQVAILALLLLLGLGTVIFAGDVLAPILAAAIIAYLLDGAVVFLRRMKVPRFIAVIWVFTLFVLILLLMMFVMAPLLVKQTTQFVLEVPRMIATGQEVLMHLPDKYPNLISQDFVTALTNSFSSEVSAFSKQVLSFSLASVFDIFAFLVYLIVVPLLVFFFLKDKGLVLRWFGKFTPRDDGLVREIGLEMNGKISSYVRGKFLEILIVWSISFVAFLFFGLNYAFLLSFLVGISVLIPYVGAAVATFPVLVVAYFQWGFTEAFFWVFGAYVVIQFLDGNLLVPLLFSEMVNLHPAAIMSAVLIFGALWGVWGVFFAIPLATLINAVINVWPALQQGEVKNT